MKFSRPKPKETEADLLRLQEEFFKNKPELETKDKPTLEEHESNVENKIKEQLANTFESIPDICVGEIKERISLNSENHEENINRILTSNIGKGFPTVKKINISKSSGGGSLFSQVHSKRIKIDESANANAASTKVNAKVQTHCDSSLPLDKKDLEEINKANINILKDMSSEEIEEQRRHYLSTLDPAIIAFLKSRKKEMPQPVNKPSVNEEESKLAFDDIEEALMLINKADENHWLNFSEIEVKKLTWMQSIKIPKEKKSQFEARFDFKGWLMEYTLDEIDEKSRILYHHGEEPGRPGYSLQELLQLSRSSVIQQKVIALNTLANILKLYSLGVYKNILEIPVEQVFFVLRFCLDDNTPVVLQAAINAMCSLIFYKIDEVCLDILLSSGLEIIQPTLGVDSQEFDYTVNDQQLVESNLIKCLLRTNILIRIKYIINTMRPEFDVVKNCLGILIRIVRDSQFVVTQICECDGLIECLIINCLPTKKFQNENSYKAPFQEAIKFFRILASRDKFLTINLLTKHEIMDPVLTYITDEYYGAKLQTECFNLWTVFLEYQLEINAFQRLQSVFMNFLHYHYTHTNIDQKKSSVNHRHLSSLLTLFTSALKNSHEAMSPFYHLLELCLCKYISQFISIRDAINVQVLTALCKFYSVFIKFKINHSFIIELVMKLLKSTSFGVISDNITDTSMLLNNYEVNKSAANFKILETSAWDASEHVIPIMQSNSCLLLLTALSELVLNTENKELILVFHQHKNIKKYVTSLITSSDYYLISNWFTRLESEFIINLIKSAIIIKSDMNMSDIYNLAVRTLTIHTSDRKQNIEFILSNIIFNQEFFPAHAFIQNMNISEDVNMISSIPKNLNEILEVYLQVLNLKSKIKFLDKLTLDVSTGSVVPVDWIYAPIMMFIQQEKPIKITENEQLNLFKNCLRWIYACEMNFPLLTTSLDPTERFCRLSCVFLAHDDLFLNSEVQRILELCFKKIINDSEDKLNFDSKIKGLTNFEDFYKQLLEQYQGVSYGNKIFGNFILLPLQQRHNVKWRKCLWSEYLGAVQALTVNKDELLFPMESLLNPIEEDLSLIRCYGRALENGSVRKQSVLYKVASYHVQSFMIKNKKEQS